MNNPLPLLFSVPKNIDSATYLKLVQNGLSTRLAVHLVTIGALINLLILKVPEIAAEFPIGDNLLEYMLFTSLMTLILNVIGLPADIFHFIVSYGAKDGDTSSYASQTWAKNFTLANVLYPALVIVMTLVSNFYLSRRIWEEGFVNVDGIIDWFTHLYIALAKIIFMGGLFTLPALAVYPILTSAWAYWEYIVTVNDSVV